MRSTFSLFLEYLAAHETEDLVISFHHCGFCGQESRYTGALSVDRGFPENNLQRKVLSKTIV